MTKDERKYLDWLKKDKYDGQARAASLAVDLGRLRAGEPLDYVIGWRPFLGCKIVLTERPLIPREETEYWAKEAIEEIKKDKRPKIKCLDIFTGSGCVGLAVLANAKNTVVTFADKSPRALKSVRKNLKVNSFQIGSHRAKVVESDVFSGLSDQFDYIFANPPYIPLGRKLPESVSRYEPREALRAGRDGLLFIKRFLVQAPAHLVEGGKIYLEFGYGQKKAVDILLKKIGFGSCVFGKDQFGRCRFAIIKNSR